MKRRLVGYSVRYVIKDPISLSHHQLWEEEYFLLQLLDGQRSMQHMRQEFENRFQPARLDFLRLEALHGMFYRSGLVVSQHAGQAATLLARSQQSRAWGWKRIFSLFLAARFRGINPDPLLKWLSPFVSWCFHPFSLTLSLALIVGTFLWAFIQWQNIWVRVPGLQEYVTVANVFWLAIAFIGLKVMHELGHGLACERFGGECNEIGIMFLAFAPCLYCDVSDAWLIDSKWRRAWVSAAGIWVELILAAMAGWLWWFSTPGTINTLCFNIMFIGGAGTLLFNGNPLLRYDGYFVLSDLMDVPNLWERSRATLRSLTRQIYFGEHGSWRGEVPDGTGRFWAVYAIASMAYQFFVTIMIMVFLYGVLEAVRLEVVGAILVAVLSVFMIAFPAVQKTIALVTDTRRLRQLRKSRVIGTLMAFIMLAAIFCYLPLPCSVRAPFIVRPSDAQPIVVVVGGQLDHCVAEGTRVRRGDVIATLSSPADSLRLEAKRGEVARYKIRLAGLEATRGSDPAIGAQIASARQAIEGCEAELRRLNAAAAQLSLRAPKDGTVIAASGRIASPSNTSLVSDVLTASTSASVASAFSGSLSATTEDGLEFWSGTPLQACNRGCYLAPGQVLCQVAADGNAEALVYLTQSRVQWVEVGQTAVARLAELPDQVLRGKVVEISAAAHRELPSELGRSGIMPVHQVGAGRYDAVEPVYVARVQFESDSKRLVAQAIGHVRIQVHPRAMGTRLWRLLSETFGWQGSTKRVAKSKSSLRHV